MDLSAPNPFGAFQGSPGGTPPDRPQGPCMTCFVNGRGGMCYWATGFASCIPCSASGQVCTGSSDFLSLCSGPASTTTTPVAVTTSALASAPPQPILTFPTGSFSSSPPSSLAAFPAPLSSGSSSSGQHPFASPTSNPTAPPPAKKRRASAEPRHPSPPSVLKPATSNTAAQRRRSSVAKSAPRSPPKGKRKITPPEPPKPFTPAEAQLVDVSAIRALATELFEESFRIRSEVWGFSQHLIFDIRGEFARVGGDMKRLGPVGEALCLIRVAWGATSTMHPGIVPSATKYQGLVMHFKGDLMAFGRERTPAHRALAGQAASLVEELGAFEVPTYRNMALLGELSILSARTDIAAAKNYSRIAVGHWRKLNARKPVVHLSPHEATIGFGIACTDALGCFYGGAKAQFDMPELSDEEVCALVMPTGVPGAGFVRPDYFPEHEFPTWTDVPLTNVRDVMDASMTACYRMLSILFSTSIEGAARIPPSTYQKVLETIVRQKPCLRRVRTKWSTEMEGREEDVLAPLTLQENMAHREYIYRLLTILHARLAESSHLLPVYERCASLVSQDISQVAMAAAELRKNPQVTSSWWGSRMQNFYRWFELLPGGFSYLATFVRDGEGTLESRRFEADTIAQTLKSIAFYGEQYIAGALEAEQVLQEFDRGAVKTFPIGYRVDEAMAA